MARSFTCPLPVLLLLTFALFTADNFLQKSEMSNEVHSDECCLSSKSEQQQQQQAGASQAVVSKNQSNGTVVAASAVLSPTPGDSSSEEVGDSVEEDDGEEDGVETEDEEDEDDAGEQEEEDDEEEDEASLPDDDTDDEYEDQLKAVATQKPQSASAVASKKSSHNTRSLEREIRDKVSEPLEYNREKKSADEQTSKDKRLPTVKKELSSQKEIAGNETQEHSTDPFHSENLIDDWPREVVSNELQETGNYEESSSAGAKQPQRRQHPQHPAADSQSELDTEDAYTLSRPSLTLKKLSKRHGVMLGDLDAYLLDKYTAKPAQLSQLGNEKGTMTESMLELVAKLVENPERWERVHRLLIDLKADMDDRQALEARKRLIQEVNPYAEQAVSRPTTSIKSPASARPTRKPKKKKKKKKKKLRQHKPTTTMTWLASTPAPPLTSTETPRPTTTLSSAAAKWRKVAERLFSPPLSDDESNVAKIRYSMPAKPRTISPMRRPFDDKERENFEALNSDRQALMLKAAREYSQPRPVHFGKINTHQQMSSDEDAEDGFEPSERAYQRAHFGQLVSPGTVYRGPPHPERRLGQAEYALNQEYLPPGREFAVSRPWAAKPAWAWQRQPNPWPPWPDYLGRLHEQRQQSPNRHGFRDNFSPWLEGKQINNTPDSWLKPEQTRDYIDADREKNMASWQYNGNNSELKGDSREKLDDDSKESPTLTMKTWNSLTSDPATWPFKLPGAKPWPKDENGKSYNPNAELVRKLGLYKNGRLRAEKDPLKDLKQQKLQKNGKESKVNSWMEPDERQSAWFNSMKLHEGFENVNAPMNDQRTWNAESPSSSSSSSADSGIIWGREKISDEWKLGKTAGTSSSTWPAKWKQFAYHKVTAQPTSKSGVTLDKPSKNAFIAVSAVSAPKYKNDWRKNDIEEIDQVGGSITEDPNHPSGQMNINIWKKSAGINVTTLNVDKIGKFDVLEQQLENLKEPVLLEVNISIKNSTHHQKSTPSSLQKGVTEMTIGQNLTSKGI